MALETGLRGKRALVTGGSTGIGLGIARALAHEEVDLAIASRTHRPDVLAELRAIGVRVEFLPVDLTQESAAADLVARTVERLGSLELLVSNAALVRHEPISEGTTDAWTATLMSNLLASMWLCRAAARHFAEVGGGSILLVGSTAAYHRAYGQAAYHVSKAALMAFSTALAVELGPSGVRVNLLVPGRFATALNPQASTGSIADIPLRRIGRVEECGPPAVFLLSERLSSYITGAELVVSGGLHLRPMPLSATGERTEG
jgi:NAD(P)-dependent dehydrogenase (short-subunit alcohol dehydrogenase family)